MKTLFSPLLPHTNSLFGGFFFYTSPKIFFPDLHLVLLSIDRQSKLHVFIHLFWGMEWKIVFPC